MGTQHSLRSPRLTRQHFQLIADTIGELDFVHEEPGTEGSTRRYVAEVFADALYPTNPRFDRDRFVRVATGCRS